MASDGAFHALRPEDLPRGVSFPILLYFSDFNTKGVALPKYIPIFVDVLLGHKARQELTFCNDNAKVHLKTVLELGDKKFLCLDEA